MSTRTRDDHDVEDFLRFFLNPEGGNGISTEQRARYLQVLAEAGSSPTVEKAPCEDFDARAHPDDADGFDAPQNADSGEFPMALVRAHFDDSDVPARVMLLRSSWSSPSEESVSATSPSRTAPTALDSSLPTWRSSATPDSGERLEGRSIGRVVAPVVVPIAQQPTATRHGRAARFAERAAIILLLFLAYLIGTTEQQRPQPGALVQTTQAPLRTLPPRAAAARTALDEQSLAAYAALVPDGDAQLRVLLDRVERAEDASRQGDAAGASHAYLEAVTAAIHLQMRIPADNTGAVSAMNRVVDKLLNLSRIGHR